MKNSFKFAFLGLALTVAFASCGGAETKTDATADSAATLVDSAATVLEHAADKVDSAAAKVDSAAVKVDSAITKK